MSTLVDDSATLHQNDIDPLLIKLAKNIKSDTNGNNYNNNTTHTKGSSPSSSSSSSASSSASLLSHSPNQHHQTYRRGKEKIDAAYESIERLNSVLASLPNGKTGTINSNNSLKGKGKSDTPPTTWRQIVVYTVLFSVVIVLVIWAVVLLRSTTIDQRFKKDTPLFLTNNGKLKSHNNNNNNPIGVLTRPIPSPSLPSTILPTPSSSFPHHNPESSEYATSLVETWELCPLHRDHPDFPSLDPTILEPHHLTTGFGGGFPHANISFTPADLTDTGGEFNANIKTDLDQVPVIMNFAVLAVTYDSALGDFLLMCVLDYQYEGRHVQHPDNFKGGDDHYDKDYHYRFHNSRANDGIRIVLIQKVLALHINKYFLCLDSVSGLLLPLTTWEIKHSYLQLHCHYPHFPNKPPHNLTITLLHNTPSVFSVPEEPAVFPSIIDNTPFSVATNITTPKIHSRFVPYTYPLSHLTIDQIKKINLNKFTYELAAPILLPLLVDPELLGKNPEMKKAISKSIGGHIHLAVCRKVTVPVSFTLCSAVLFTNHFLPHIRHFINYHAYLGIDRFYIYDRFGHYRKTLLPYINSGMVVYKRWPAWYHPSIPLRYVYYDQLVALEQCRWLNGQKTQYAATFDFDEWLSVPIESSLPRFPHSCVRYKRDPETIGALYAYMTESSLDSSDLKPEIIKAAQITGAWSTNGCHSSLLYLVSISLNTMMKQTFIGYHSIRMVQIRMIGESEESKEFHKLNVKDRHYSLQTVNSSQEFPLPLHYTLTYTFNYDSADTVRSKYIYRPFQPTQAGHEVHYFDFPLGPEGEWISVLTPHLIRFNHYVNWIFQRADTVGEKVVEDKMPMEIYWQIQELGAENSEEVVLPVWKPEDELGLEIGIEVENNNYRDATDLNSNFIIINPDSDKFTATGNKSRLKKMEKEKGDGIPAGREGRAERLAKLIRREKKER